MFLLAFLGFVVEEEEEEGAGGVRWENWWFSWLGKCVGFVVVWFGCGKKDWWLYSVALPIGMFSFLHFASHKYTHNTYTHNTYTHREKPQVLLLKKYPLFLHLWKKKKLSF